MTSQEGSRMCWALLHCLVHGDSQAASEPCMQCRPFLLCLFILFHQLTLVLMHVERNLNNCNFDLQLSAHILICFLWRKYYFPTSCMLIHLGYEWSGESTQRAEKRVYETQERGACTKPACSGNSSSVMLLKPESCLFSWLRKPWLKEEILIVIII